MNIATQKMSENKQEIERFKFRNLAPNILLGTASDRYAGWIGQIYTRERYEGRINSRTKTAKKTHKLNFAVQNKTRDTTKRSSRNSNMTDESSLFPKEECFENKYGKQINSCLGM